MAENQVNHSQDTTFSYVPQLANFTQKRINMLGKTNNSMITSRYLIEGILEIAGQVQKGTVRLQECTIGNKIVFPIQLCNVMNVRNFVLLVFGVSLLVFSQFDTLSKPR